MTNEELYMFMNLSMGTFLFWLGLGINVPSVMAPVKLAGLRVGWGSWVVQTRNNLFCKVSQALR